MTNELLTRNQATIYGTVIENFTFDHKVDGEGFYRTKVRTPRLNDGHDDIIVVISERLIDIDSDWVGSMIHVDGQYRSYNKRDESGGHNKLILFLFAKEVEAIAELPHVDECNVVCLKGKVCKDPIYRRTPRGKRITDIHLAVNRMYGKSDYIPCVFWNSDAEGAKNKVIGEGVTVYGRIQSREYDKKISETEIERRTAYEVSVFNFEEFQTPVTV